jgi:hypothetical protein
MWAPSDEEAETKIEKKHWPKTLSVWANGGIEGMVLC